MTRAEGAAARETRAGRRRLRSLPIGRQLWRTLLPLVATAALWLLCRTIRVERVGAHYEEEAVKAARGFIYAFWHGQLLYFCYSHRGRGIMVLTSPSDDGELITRVIERLGFLTSRGSITGGGGAKASLRLVHYMTRSAMPTGVCPDGPRGPRCVASKGSVFLAQRAGAPMVPLANSFKRRKLFNTWDRFVVPCPFTRGVIVFGPPILVPKDASEAVIEHKRKELEQALNAVTAQADAHFGR